MSTRRPVNEAELETLQRETFDYFVHEANPANGLIIDKTEVVPVPETVWRVG